MRAGDPTKTIEAAIRDRHVLELFYNAEATGPATLTVEPLAIRFNSAGHRVLWARNRGEGHIAELLWDRIGEARDTGEVFEPREWERAES